MKKLFLSLLLLAGMSFGQTTVAPITNPRVQFFNNSVPCAGCLLDTFSAGTLTPLATYSESTGTTPNANPVVLGSDGSAVVYLTSASYKFRLRSALGVTLWTQDVISWNTPLTTFAGLTDAGNLTQTQPTAATNVANQSSFSDCMNATYWTGAVSATDSWCLQDILGTGTNPASTFTLTHSGSSGASTFSIPGNVSVGGTLGAKQIDGVCKAENYSGSDWGAKVNAAIADATCIVIDARNFTTPQAAAATVTLNRSVLLEVGPYSASLAGSPGLLISANGASVVGQGRNATKLRSNNATADLIQTTGIWDRAQDLWLDADVLRTAGAGVHVAGGGNNHFLNLRIQPNNIGMLFDTINAGNNIVQNVHIGGSGTGGNWVSGIQIGGIAAGTVSSNEFVDDFITGESTFSNAMLVLRDGSDGNQFVNLQMVSAGSGLSSVGIHFETVVGGLVPEWTFLTNVVVEAGARGSNCIVIDQGRYIRSVGGYVGDCQIGIQVNAGKGIWFTNGIIYDNNQDGAVINGGSDVNFQENKFADNGIQTNATYNDVTVAAGVQDWTVANNTFTSVVVSPPANKTLANVSVAAGASDRYRIEGNAFGNISSGTAFIVDNGTGVNKSIRNPATGGVPSATDLFPVGTVKITGHGQLPANTTTSLFIGGGYGSPILGTLYCGDGTGWEFDFDKRTGSADTVLWKCKDNGGWYGVERAAAAGEASSDVFYPDSTAHRYMQNNNNAGVTYVGDTIMQDCGTTTTCSATNLRKPQIVKGNVALSGGTATITGISPAFTSSTSFECTSYDATTLANPSKAVGASGSSVTVTGTGTDVIHYVCAGN